MLTIRRYRESDSGQVGILIADTYSKFNLSTVSGKQRETMLGPFLHARSQEAVHRKAIADALRAPTVLVAEVDGTIVGVLRDGRVDKLGRTVIKLLATMHAIPFYLEMGYRKSTGIRSIHSFEGAGLPSQPMKRVLKRK